MKKLLIILFLAFSAVANATTYYLAPNGNDATGKGSITAPWFSLNMAWSMVNAGDIIYLRGGTYTYTTQQSLCNKSGSAGNLIKIWAYPGEVPKLMHTQTSGWFIYMEKSNYIHFKGIEVSGENHIGSGLNWELYNCNYNILENLNYHDMVQGLFIKEQSTGNLVLNCDFHHNQDPNSSPAYENADGFGFSWSDDAGLTNTVRGCRFYWNCDDGMDMWSNDNTVIIDSCWSFYNGYKPGTFTQVGTGGNGFKFGTTDIDHGSEILITVKNCISYKNKMYGYNQNGANARIAFYNNIAYMNIDYGFWLKDYSTKAHILTNNIAYNNGDIGVFSSASIFTTNTFLSTGNNSLCSVSDADFQSVTGDLLMSPRKANGSLPDIAFLKLASTSDLIDKGTDVGIPYAGTKPDLGPFEYNLTTISIPVYTGSVVQNATPNILEMTYSVGLANIVPSVSAFSIQVNSVSRTINSVAIVGGKVQLTLSTPVIYGDIVTVAYSAPAASPLQTTSGGKATGISAQNVTNNVNPVSLVYVSSVVANATPSLLTMTYNVSLANILPSASSFTVLVNSVKRTVNSVAVSGTNVILTLSNSIVYGDAVTVAYSKPASNPLQSSAGSQASSFSAQTVTNNVNPVSLVYVSSVVSNASPLLLTVTYNVSLANILPATSSFSVLVNSVRRTVNSVSVSGTNIQLSLSSPVVYGDIITLSYTKPSSNPLQSTAGSQASNLSTQTVTNNVNPVSLVYVSSVITNATTSLLTMTYNVSLANNVPAASSFTVLVNSSNRTVSSVAISGTNVLLTLASPVVYGDVITITYTKPSSNPLQSTAGSQASNLSTQTVTNNVNPVSLVYVSSVITNATPSLLTMTYNVNLANNVPAASSFTVLVNSSNRTVSSVAISGTNVLLTLASPVVYGDVITIAYAKPSSNPLQSTAGSQASNLSTQTVTNSVNPVSLVYVSSVVTNASPTLLTMTYNVSLTNNIPAATAFTVLVNSINRAVTSVAVSGTNVLLTLSSPVVYGDILTLAYTKPASNPLQSSAGSQASSISAQTVTNNVNPVSLVYGSSVVANANPSLLTMTYNLSLSNNVPAASAFNVLVNSVNRTVSSVTVSGTNVLLTLSSPVVYGDIITVSYTKPASNPLQSSTGSQASNLSGKTVTNNVNPVSLVYVSSVVTNATPALVTMTYNVNLANNTPPPTSSFTVLVNSLSRTISSVAVSGTNVLITLSSPVSYGDIVTVAYTVPASNQLKSTDGSQASGISAQTVTNNVNPISLVYVSSVITDAAPSLLTITFNLSLANIVPASSAFTVLVNSAGRTVNAVAISGTNVLLTLAGPVVYGDIITLAYNKPVSNPLQSSVGSQAVSIGSQTVTNKVNPVNLTYVSSVIEDAAPSKLIMTYNLSLTNIVPSTSAFRVQVNSVSRTVNSVAISGTNVILTLSNPVIYGDNVTVLYTRPLRNRLQSTSGSQASSISTQTVTNNVQQVDLMYVSSAVPNSTPTKLTMTYNLNLMNIVPPTSAFSVMVNSISRAVNSVSVSGANVILTLASPIVYGDVVTVGYTVPANNPLQNSSGSKASGISAQPVTNYVNPANPYYISSVIENNDPSLLILGFNLSLADIIPNGSAFTVKVNSVVRSVNSVAISGTNVLLTLVSQVFYGDIITVTYTKPNSNPIQSNAGGLATGFSAQTVTNNVSPATPYYVSSAVENATPFMLTLTYNLNLANIVPVASAFTVMVNSVNLRVNSVTIVNGKVQLILESPIGYADIVTISYSIPDSYPLQSLTGGLAAAISDQSVTNNINPDNPYYLTATIEDASPALLTMTYNMSLSNNLPVYSAFTVLVNSVNRAIESIDINKTYVMLTLESPVVYGDVVTVSYSKPAINPLQSNAGGQATSISAQPVNNNVNPGKSISLSYLSSVIENATPALLTMTYNFNLGSIIPDSSAFTILVNSIKSKVNSVDIKGTNILLTLASPIVFGDIVTISYTKPEINPIQTGSGIEADGIGAQPVTNHVSFTNSPPNLVINYSMDNYSGFIGEIDASGSYDADMDNLTFEWTVPDNLETSSTTGSKIQFLAPLVQETETFEIYLSVSDGKSVESQVISLNVLPYKPELSVSKIDRVTASRSSVNNLPGNLVDNKIETLWSSDGANQWVIFKLDKAFDPSYFEISFQKGQRRAQYFDIYASKDSLQWDPILTKLSSCNFAGGYQIFDIPEESSKLGYSYIKLIGQTNSEDSWNKFSEFKIFGKLHYYKVQINVYPNPAHNFVNVAIGYPTVISINDVKITPSIIRISDMSGHLVIEKTVDPGVNNIQIPINIKSGIYIIHMVEQGMIIATQKLIVVN